MFDLSQTELLLRLLAAILLGGMIGFERELGERPAGLRTHALAAEGAALFTLAGLLLANQMASSGFGATDPNRIASTVVQGIGFLAAGVIFAQGRTVKGLTTAASLWVTAAIGVLAGLGLFFLAISAAVAALILLWIVKRLEDSLEAGHHHAAEHDAPE